MWKWFKQKYKKQTTFISAIGAVLLVLLGIFIEQVINHFNKWEDIDNQAQVLMNIIILADNKNNLAPPPYSSDRLSKMEFIKDAQIKAHYEQWVLLSQQIPIIKNNSSQSDWSAALSGHKSIEKSKHPNEIVVLEQKAKWMALNQSYKGFPVAALPVEIISYSGISKSTISCKNCENGHIGVVTLPESLVSSNMKLNGYVITKLPKGWNPESFPVLDLHRTEVADHLQSNNPDQATKGRYFLPFYEDLIEIEKLGGKVKAFEEKGEK